MSVNIRIIGLTMMSGGQCAIPTSEAYQTLEDVTDALDKAVEESLEKSYSAIPWITFLMAKGAGVGDVRISADKVTSVWYDTL